MGFEDNAEEIWRRFLGIIVMIACERTFISNSIRLESSRSYGGRRARYLEPFNNSPFFFSFSYWFSTATEGRAGRSAV